MAEISDLDRQIEQLRRCELIKESEVKALCAKARSGIGLGWPGLVTLVFCLQRDLGRGEQRSEGGLASHSMR